MKDSLQYRRTTREIVRAFENLLRKKKFNEISVKNIMDEAMISRSTFYLHFSDKYDIVEQLNKKYTNKLVSILNQVNDEKNPNFKHINPLLNDFFMENSEKIKLLCSIKDMDYNFSIYLKNVLVGYYEKQNPNLRQLEAKVLTAQITEYLLYYIYHPEQTKNFASDYFHDQIDLIFAAFSINANSEDKTRMMNTLRSFMDEKKKK